MASILEGIDSPEQVQKLSLPELEQLAAEIRERLITVLSNNGGHLGPNLGVVELTIALHYVFHTPSDSFLFDVSHQAYVHKLLTGRQERFHTIRTPGGLNGFMLRTESPHDCYGAGHAGTALSAALGMAVARDKTGGKEHVVAVAGDAAFTCGITYEALNNIAHHTKRLIVVLNDNEWSIDKNVGAIASYLNKIVTSPRFDYLHERAGKLVEKVGGVERPAHGAQGRRSRQGHAVAQRHLRGTGPEVLWPDRRPRHRHADQDVRVSEEAGPSRAAARAHPEGQGLRARHAEAEEVSRAGSLRSRDRRDQAAGPPHLLRGVRRHAW